MEINKKNVIIGVLSLIISAILQAVVTLKYKSDWISLVFLIIYAILFLRCWHDDGLKRWIKSKFNKKSLKMIGFASILVAFTLLPQSLGQNLGEVLEFCASIVSFICWMLGLFLIQVSSENG